MIRTPILTPPAVAVFVNGKRHAGPVTVVHDVLRVMPEVHITLPLPEGLVLHSLDEVIRLWAKESK